MATKNLNNFKRVLKNILCWCINSLVCMGIFIVLNLSLLLMSLVVYNPFVFVPLFFLFPKTAAKLLYKVDWGGYTDFWQKFYAPLVGVLPLSWKKKIMLSGGIEKISPKKQCNFILDVYTGSNDDQNAQPIHFIKKISPEAVDLLWNYYQPDDCEYWDLREKIVKAGQRLTDEQFKILLYWKH